MPCWQKSLRSAWRSSKPAQKVFWGGYSGYFADPDGYLWEVAYNPFLAFDERDDINWREPQPMNEFMV